MNGQSSPTLSLFVIWWSRLKQAGVAFVLAGSKPLARIAILILLLVLLMWLAWQYVWVVLRQPAGIAPGITPTNPSIDADLLQSITSERQRRMTSTPPSLGAYSGLFSAP